MRQLSNARAANSRPLRADKRAGRHAAMVESGIRLSTWDTTEHGETGYLIAQALRVAVDMAGAGGLKCEYRAVTEVMLRGERRSGFPKVQRGHLAHRPLERVSWASIAGLQGARRHDPSLCG